jgi:hypothetical protein
MRFQVEYIHTGRGFILAKQLDAGPFALSETSRLNGRRVEPVLTMPRALNEDGTHRLDLFVFHPRSPDRFDDWQAGSIVVLTD